MIRILTICLALAHTARLQDLEEYQGGIDEDRSLGDEIVLTIVGFFIVLLGVIVRKIQQKGCKRYFRELCDGPSDPAQEPLMPKLDASDLLQVGASSLQDRDASVSQVLRDPQFQELNFFD